MNSKTVYDETHGWQSLNGYQTYNCTFRGGRKRAMEEFVERSGLNIVGHTLPANAQFRSIRFDAFYTAYIHTTPMVISWEREYVTSRRRFMFVLVNSGNVEVRTETGSVSTPTGAVAIVFPGSGKVHIEAKTPSEIVCFSFDKDEIRPIDLKPESVTALLSDSPVFRASYSYLCGIVHSPESAEIGSAQVLRELTRNVARALTLESSSTAPKENTLAQIQQQIELRYQSASFNVDKLAQEIGLSRRTLERACSDEGLSLSDEIRLHRTRHALHLILEQPGMRLQEIATESGFTSAEVMRRAFLRNYGSTPAQLRKTAIPNGQPLTHSAVAKARL